MDTGLRQLERDHQVVPLFDGSTWVNRAGLAAVLPVLRPGRGRAASDAGSPVHWLRTDHALDPLDTDRLRLMAPRDAVLGALPGLVAELAAEEPESDTTALARALLAECGGLSEGIAALRPTAGAPSTAVMRLAERYEWCFAGAAALALHRARPRLSDGPWGGDALWLRGCLALALEGLGAEPPQATQVYAELGAHLTSAADLPATLLDTSADADAKQNSATMRDQPSAGSLPEPVTARWEQHDRHRLPHGPSGETARRPVGHREPGRLRRDRRRRRTAGGRGRRRVSPDDFGLHAEFVPRTLGGRLERLDHMVELMRSVYRRDSALGLGRAGQLLPTVNV